MTVNTAEYRMSTAVDLPYDRAVERTREELAKEGFGVLTEIDVKATLRQKLNVDFRPYIILGACNPPLAHRALSSELDIGVFLPCNVIVYQAEESGKSVVATIDPEVSLARAGNETLRPLAEDVKARLRRVLDAVVA